MNQTVKLKKIEAGEYKSEDGRFYILNTYAPNGCPGRINLSKNTPWLVEDKANTERFYSGIHLSGKKSINRYDTLKEAKEAIALIYKVEAEEKLIEQSGYTKIANQQAPGRCWKSPQTGALLVRSEALIELSQRCESSIYRALKIDASNA